MATVQAENSRPPFPMELHCIKRAPKAMSGWAVYDWHPEIAALVYKTRLGEWVPLFDVQGSYFLVPRMLAPFVPDGAAEGRTMGAPILKYAINCIPRSDDQARVIKESRELLAQYRTHIIEASTGFGKTYVGCALAADSGVKTLVVVNKEDNLTNWRNSFLKFTTLSPDRIGIIQQNKAEIVGRDVCLGMVHSLAKDHYGDIYGEFGFVIFDEVHHMAAETFSKVNGMFRAMWRLGLSATAERVDGKELVFQSHIGPVLVSGKSIPMPPSVLVVKSDFKLPRVKRRVDGEVKMVPLPHEMGKVMHINKLLAKCESRNAIIVDFVVEAVANGRHVLVLSDLKAHLKTLFDMLVAAGVSGGSVGYYVSGMSEKALSASTKLPVVLGTYGMAGESTDVPWWSAVVLATPRANAKQAIGRGCRTHPGKPQPVILDILDADSFVFEAYFFKRLKMYSSEELGAHVEYMN